MNDCKKVLDLLNEYIDGELSESDAALVRAHLDTCPSCQRAYRELSEISALFEAEAEAPPAELCGSVMEKIRAEKTASAKRIKFAKIFGGVAVAAVISLTVLASPAILMIANGGAKAECNDLAEAPSTAATNKSPAENFYTDDRVVPECELDVKEDGSFDAVEDVVETVTTASGVSTVYEVHMVDGSKSTLSLSDGIAIFDGVECEYSIGLGRYYIHLKDKTVTLVKAGGDEVYFKEVQGK